VLASTPTGSCSARIKKPATRPVPRTRRRGPARRPPAHARPRSVTVVERADRRIDAGRRCKYASIAGNRRSDMSQWGEQVVPVRRRHHEVETARAAAMARPDVGAVSPEPRGSTSIRKYRSVWLDRTTLSVSQSAGNGNHRLLGRAGRRRATSSPSVSRGRITSHSRAGTARSRVRRSANTLPTSAAALRLARLREEAGHRDSRLRTAMIAIVNISSRIVKPAATTMHRASVAHDSANGIPPKKRRRSVFLTEVLRAVPQLVRQVCLRASACPSSSLMKRGRRSRDPPTAIAAACVVLMWLKWVGEVRLFVDVEVRASSMPNPRNQLTRRG